MGLFVWGQEVGKLTTEIKQNLFESCLAWRTLIQKILSNFVSGSITVRQTSCLTDSDWTKQVNLLLTGRLQSIVIQANKAGRQLYSGYISTYLKVSDYSLTWVQCSALWRRNKGCWHSVSRLGDLSPIGQLFKECVNAFLAKLAKYLFQFLTKSNSFIFTLKTDIGRLLLIPNLVTLSVA